jgi:O-antigen ligase
MYSKNGMSVKPLLLLKAVFLLGLFLMPFIYWPLGQIPYEIPRVWFFCHWVEILGILSLFAIGSLDKKKKIDKFLVCLLIFWSLWNIFSSLWGVDFAKSYWGNYFRADGLNTFFHLVAFSLFLILFWDKTWWKQTATIISLSGLVISLWSLFSTQNYVSFGHINFLSGFLLMVMPLTLSLISGSFFKNENIFWIVSLGLQILAIFLTFSRGGILGIILFFIAAFALFKTKISIKCIFFAFLLLATLFSINWYKQDKAFTFESRERILMRGLLAFKEKPISGWGVANFDHAFNSMDWPMKYDQDITADKAHSTFLEILVTTGTVGFLLYFFVLIKLFSKISKVSKNNKYLFLIFLLYLFHGQTTIISISEEIFFWLLIGISANS